MRWNWITPSPRQPEKVPGDVQHPDPRSRQMGSVSTAIGRCEETASRFLNVKTFTHVFSTSPDSNSRNLLMSASKPTSTKRRKTFRIRSRLTRCKTSSSTKKCWNSISFGLRQQTRNRSFSCELINKEKTISSRENSYPVQ